ncbi:ABC transporter, permease protein [Nitrospirillum viridazoti Y2]|uniref:ABC transport system permease protein n=1 Tax=Nitrospirillum amazonense TaxID=28077 RepID=A0A560IZF2_9PROT|nr:ABC transporter permease [Nitrospirillum amazonense]EGX99812.1 ABC transporter, permease protein [Nitrospirillum amazonense Y2]TWB64286.1 putative ABC transport system permease protein [Nitrospirillum amazonense]
MFANYLTVALRTLIKHKLYSAITVAGLALGLTAAILIGLFVHNELTYDRDVTDADRIQQVLVTATLPGRAPEDGASLPMPLGPALKQAFPQVAEMARIAPQTSSLKRDETLFSEQAAVADASFFRLFDWPFLVGDRATALDDPNSVVLTAKTAAKYFGDANPLGRTLSVDGHLLRVTGVMRDLPANTQFAFALLVPMDSQANQIPDYLRQHWGGLMTMTFLKLKPGASPDLIQAGLPAFGAAIPPIRTNTGEVHLGDMFKFFLVPLTEAHLHPVRNAMVEGTSPIEIGIFTAVAVLVLAIACINFMNLATARASLRAREVALRKVVGASRGQIMVQFLGESILLTGLALILAVALVEVLLPSFTAFLGKPSLAFNYLRDARVLGCLAALVLLVGGAGGLYPAIFLSAFQPGPVLKGNSGGSGAGGRLRVVLVVLQFAISISLMVATGVVYGQLAYAQGRALGFNKENIVVLTDLYGPELQQKAETLRDALRQDPRIAAAALAESYPGSGTENNTGVNHPGAPADDGAVVLRRDAVDADYFSTLKVLQVAGRVFDREHPADAIPPADPANPQKLRHGGVVLNRSAVRRLGYASPEAALGQPLMLPGKEGEAGVEVTVVGVVEDFHQGSVHTAVAPQMFLETPKSYSQLLIRVKAGEIPGALDLIDRSWRQLVPDRPVPRVFLDAQLQSVYERETKTGQLFAVFSGLAIVIAALGLFGLASFTAERRTKEIGLRKVLGAGVTDIVRLLVWQFSKPVLVANVIAWPVAWVAMRHWLDGFADRVPLNPLLFVASGLSALMVAWATVGLHAARVAATKPVVALRYE